MAKKRKTESLNMHEGLSSNQVRIILVEFGLDAKEFNKWLYGQTCPIIPRYDEKGKVIMVGGIYEYDLFRWIDNQKNGTRLIWD